jgi:signal transduction histidine kinase
MGLSIMRERAEAVGARLEIESQHAKGTRLTVAWAEEECRTENADG